MQDWNAYEFSGKEASELRKRVSPSVTETGLRGQEWRTSRLPVLASVEGNERLILGYFLQWTSLSLV